MDDKDDKNIKGANVTNPFTGESWIYSEEVKDHFFNPRNILIIDPKEDEFNGHGEVGSPACGDIMDVWIKVNQDNDKISSFKWRTFGCASAIASTSAYSEMITENGGLKIDDALKIGPREIMERLGGLPTRKIHCSVLADKAFRKALNDYFRTTGQHDRILIEGGKVIDKKLNITEKDIEEAVLHGAKTIEDLQHKLKVGIGDPAVLEETEQLLRFYNEKLNGKIENG